MKKKEILDIETEQIVYEVKKEYEVFVSSFAYNKREPEEYVSYHFMCDVDYCRKNKIKYIVDANGALSKIGKNKIKKVKEEDL